MFWLMMLVLTLMMMMMRFGNNDFVIDGKDIDCISAIIDDVPLLACFECFGVLVFWEYLEFVV